MQILKKIAFASVEENGSGESIIASLRSTGATINTGNLCSTETLTNTFYILSSTDPIITTGDIAYNTNNLSSPFNGADKFYKMTFSYSAGVNDFVGQIDSSGVITVLTAC